MPEAAWSFAAAVLGFAGMAWLALAMDVHWGQVMHRPAAQASRTRARLRTLGAAALPLSLLACLAADRPSMAVLVWFMLLAGSALAVALALAWKPRLLALMWPVPAAPAPSAAQPRAGGAHQDLPLAAAPLHELPLTVPATVAAVLPQPGAPESGRWLEEIGFLPGESVTVLAHGLPGADPLVVRVGDSTFALRRAEAACIAVVPAPEIRHA
jgi:Fe2+ transport system protein FeoA